MTVLKGFIPPSLQILNERVLGPSVVLPMEYEGKHFPKRGAVFSGRGSLAVGRAGI